MNKLFWANLSRLFQNMTFRIGCILMAGLGVYLPILFYMEDGSNAAADDYFFVYNIVIGIFCAAFCSLYLGTEYSEGTIRNKLIAGHTRRNIYLANLIVCAIASFLAALAYLTAETLTGLPLAGGLKMDRNELLIRALVSILMMISFTSIFTLRSMLSQNKASAAVINILLFFALLLLAFVIDEKLQQPEFLPFSGHMDELGNMVWDQNMPNPKFLQGTARAVYEFVYDFLPSGQALQMCGRAALCWKRMALCDIGITAVTAALGLYLFQRKDIK